MIEDGQVIAGLEGQHAAHLVLRVMFQRLAGIAMKKEAMDSKYVHPRIIGISSQRPKANSPLWARTLYASKVSIHFWKRFTLSCP
jgi:hypothetical protein